MRHGRVAERHGIGASRLVLRPEGYDRPAAVLKAGSHIAGIGGTGRGHRRDDDESVVEALRAGNVASSCSRSPPAIRMLKECTNNALIPDVHHPDACILIIMNFMLLHSDGLSSYYSYALPGGC